MIIDIENFWNESCAMWHTINEFKSFEDAVVWLMNRESYIWGDDVEFNYNKTKTAFYARNCHYVARVGSEWGNLEKCYWDTDKKTSGLIQVSELSYVGFDEIPNVEVNSIDRHVNTFDGVDFITINTSVGGFSLRDNPEGVCSVGFIKDNLDKVSTDGSILSEAILNTKLKNALDRYNGGIEIWNDDY